MAFSTVYILGMVPGDGLVVKNCGNCRITNSGSYCAVGGRRSGVLEQRQTPDTRLVGEWRCGRKRDDQRPSHVDVREETKR